SRAPTAGPGAPSLQLERHRGRAHRYGVRAALGVDVRARTRVRARSTGRARLRQRPLHHRPHRRQPHPPLAREARRHRARSDRDRVRRGLSLARATAMTVASRRRPSILSLLFGANAVVVALPLLALAGLRVYDVYLLRQTERQLLAESVVVAETFRE